MTDNLLFGLSALLTLLPSALFPYARVGAMGGEGRAEGQGAGRGKPPPLFWAGLALAATGPLARITVAGNWHTGLATALWATIGASLILFAAMAWRTRGGWRLAALLLPYLFWLGVVATLAENTQAPELKGGAPELWIIVHIVVSVVTYALLTLAAVASLAAFLQGRALKAKRPTPLTRFLPPMAESEVLQVRLMLASEAVLGLGLLTGMAVLHYEQGVFLRLDHKTLFSAATFVVIGGLLLAQASSGVRGRTAARLVLIAYLLLTLAYPGVKFVTDVLLS